LKKTRSKPVILATSGGSQFKASLDNRHYLEKNPSHTHTHTHTHRHTQGAGGVTQVAEHCPASVRP
jgi:hypothetical protein